MERYKVNVTDEAKADMRGAARYLAVELRETETAYSLLDRLDVEITSLEELPERYRLVGDAYLASLGIRMTMAGHYLIFYSVDRTSYTVTILRMLHGRRDWVKNLYSQLSHSVLAGLFSSYCVVFPCDTQSMAASKRLVWRKNPSPIRCVSTVNTGSNILTKQHTDGKPSST